MARLAIIARADATGLGNQTRRLVEMLNPERVLVIDSTPFNQNQQDFTFFEPYNWYKVTGFPDRQQITNFLRGMDIVLSCETFYNKSFVKVADSLGVKTLLQFNYEFLDYLQDPSLELPTKLLSPSHWHMDELSEKFNNVIYLPPPMDMSNFYTNGILNYKRNNTKRRFLHIVGKGAYLDRNGTLDLLESLKYTKSDFELVIKYQTISDEVKNHPQAQDPRVIFDSEAPKNEADLYKDFDAMILPRRYAGQCLPMNEALASCLPVIMTDIDPNNKILPENWLVKSHKVGEFMTRAMIDYYSADHKALAKTIDNLCKNDLQSDKEAAYAIAEANFCKELLLDKYTELINEVTQ